MFISSGFAWGICLMLIYVIGPIAIQPREQSNKGEFGD